MSTSNNNYSILPWYDDARYQNHRKTYAFGQVFPLIAETYKLPCFQVFRTTALTNPITSVTLRRLETGDEFEISGALTIAGLEVQSFTPTGSDAYDLIVYPGIDAMTDVGPWPEGMYECVMTDGTNTWYSERFCWKNDVSKYIKISYWHDVPFSVPRHHISYRDPFKSFCYLNSQINRPNYIEEDESEEKDGYLFPIYQISKKRYRILGLLLPEYLCDALRLVWMHHYVTVQWDGITYTVDDIRFIFDSEWEEQGNLCKVVVEFHTDTVVTQTGFIKDENDGGDYDQTDYNDDYLIS